MAKSTQIGTIAYSTSASRAISRISSVQVDRRYILFSDGITGLWSWDSSMTAPALVQDLVPYLPDNAGSTSTSGNESKPINQCPYVLAGDFLMYYRNRVFLADRDRSRVRYSGTRTDLALREGETDSFGNYAAIKPWQLWNQGMDLSRYNPGYGGSVIIGNVKHRITGMVGVEEGILVFKEKSIYLWNWPESAAPHEVSNGASIRIFADNLGAVGQDAIVQMGDDVIFMSRDNRGAISIYALLGGELKDLSKAIYKDLQNIDFGTNPRLQVLGSYLYVAYDNGDGEMRIRHGYDLNRTAWFDMTSPRINSWQPSLSAGRLLVGTDTGDVLTYPANKHTDIDIDRPLKSDGITPNEAPIPFLIRTKRIDFGDPLVDKKYRKAWAVVETDSEDLDIFLNLLYNDEHTNTHEPVYDDSVSDLDFPTYTWDFQEDDTINLTQGINNISTTVTKRAKNVVMELAGNSDKRVNIHAIKVGMRPRSQK